MAYRWPWGIVVVATDNTRVFFWYVFVTCGFRRLSYEVRYGDSHLWQFARQDKTKVEGRMVLLRRETVRGGMHNGNTTCARRGKTSPIHR